MSPCPRHRFADPGANEDIEVSGVLQGGQRALQTVTILTKRTRASRRARRLLHFRGEPALTLRTRTLRCSRWFRRERESEMARYDSGQRILEGFVDTRVEHIADVLENTGRRSTVFRTIFFGGHRFEGPSRRCGQACRDEEPPNLEGAPIADWALQRSDSRLRESLAGLRRLLSFFHCGAVNLPPKSPNISGLSGGPATAGDHASFSLGKSELPP